MRERSTAVLVLLTFVGMVGIYVVLWMAYQKYQQYSATLQGGRLTGLLGLLK